MKKSVLGTIVSIFVFCVFALYSRSAQALDLPRGDEQFGPRDRVHAFCDPAEYPREARGEFLDCSGYDPTVTPGQQNQPSGTPAPTGGVGGGPTTTPGPNNDSNHDCDPGKPFTGPFCGWSPSEDHNDNGGGGGIGGVPEVQGLSYTSGVNDLAPSDIMSLLGVLCLLLYARSKFENRNTIKAQ